MHSHLQKASVKIGPLICQGIADTKKLSKCQDYKEAGYPSGFYFVEEEQHQALTIVFCNFTSATNPEQIDRTGDLMYSLLPFMENFKQYCSNYSVLDDATRKHSAKEGDCLDNYSSNCDWKGDSAWYRIQGDAGTKLRTGKPEGNCGTSGKTVFLPEDFAHPTSIGHLKTVEVEYHSYYSTVIKIVKCPGFYVYYLNPGSSWEPFRYCTEA